MDDLEALGTASDEFGRRLAAVGPEQWSARTPCGEWDVTALVEHLNVGNRMGELLLQGADAKTSVGPAAHPAAGADPVATYAATSAGQVAAFAEDGALTRTVTHPAMEMSGEMLLMFRTLDLTMHAWDLATSLGMDASLDPDLCASLWTRLEPIAPLLAGSGLFGTPTRDLAPDPSAQDKLLHATGR